MLDNTTLLFIDIDDKTNTFVFTPVHIELIHQYDDGLSKLGLTDAGGEYVELYQHSDGRYTSALGWTIKSVDITKCPQLREYDSILSAEERMKLMEAHVDWEESQEL